MSVAQFPAKMPPKTLLRTSRLNEIAAILGVSAEVFYDPLQPYVLHTGEDGTRWILGLSDQGVASVRIDSTSAGQKKTEENALAFLARDVGSPQQQALSALVDHLLVMHLSG